MKFYLLCSRLTLVFSLLLVGAPMSSYAGNIDSLKQVLKTSDNGCPIVYELYKHYESIGDIDAMNLYAKSTIRNCINSVGNSLELNDVVFDQYEQGFANNINPVVDSLLDVMEDPELKLLFLVKMSKANLIFYNKDGFDKYWNHAENALTYAKEDHSRFVYYNFLGYKNREENKVFAAIQSLELAASFAKEDRKSFLENNLDLAYIYLMNGDAEKSKGIFYDLLKRAEEEDDKTKQVYLYYGLMDCYIESGDYYDAIKMAYKSIDLADRNNVNVPNGFSYCVLGQSYLALYGMDSSSRYLDKSTDNNQRDNVTLTYLDSAKYFLDKGVESSIERDDSKELADNYYILSDYYKAIGNRKQAKLYLTKAIEKYEFYDHPETYKKFADLWAADKNYSKAYFYLNRYVEGMLEVEENTKGDMVLATKIIEDSYSYKEESQEKLLIAKQKEERLRNIVILTIAGLVLFVLLLLYMQSNRKKQEVLNKQIGQRNKELDILINKQKETIKYLDNFASVAAHDLKAPIRTASSFAGLLAKTSADDLSEKGKECLNFIGSSVSQLSKMIDDLLSLSRLDANLPEEKEVDLKEVVSEIELLLSNLLKEKNAKIVVESTLPKVMGHATLLSQLFQNLIKNAIYQSNG